LQAWWSGQFVHKLCNSIGYGWFNAEAPLYHALCGRKKGSGQRDMVYSSYCTPHGM
jgi:hypothetical protein